MDSVGSMKFIWTNNKRWVEMGGPWLGSWNVKVAPLCMAIMGVAFFLGIIFMALLEFKNPIEVIIKILQTEDAETAMIRGAFILIPASLILSSLVACMNTRWFQEKSIIIVYDQAVYVHDEKRGGMLLKKGDVKTLAIIEDIFLIFLLKRMKRGIKYMSIVLKEPIPKEIIEKIINILKPEKFVRLKAGKRILVYHTEVLVYLLLEKHPELIEEFVERDYTEHWNAMYKSRFGFYGWYLGHLLDSLIALGMKREALAIALAPAYLSPGDYVKGVERGLSWVLRSMWRRFLMTAPDYRSPLDLTFIFVIFPGLLCVGLIFVGGVAKIVHIPDKFWPIFGIYLFYSVFANVYWVLAIPYYNSVVYFQAGRRSFVFFVLRALVDVFVITLLYLLFINWIHLLFYVVFLFSSIFYACAISGLYVFLRAREIGSSVVREFFRINPDLERVVNKLLESS